MSLSGCEWEEILLSELFRRIKVIGGEAKPD